MQVSLSSIPFKQLGISAIPFTVAEDDTGLRDALAKIRRESTAVVDSPEIDKTTEVKRCVAYRADNLDATFAAAMIVDAIGHAENVAIIPVLNDVPYDRLARYEHAMLIGLPEVQQGYLNTARLNGKSKITVLAHKGTHLDLDAIPEAPKSLFGKGPEPKQWNGRLNVVRPTTDSYGPVADAMCNTMTSVAYDWIIAHQLSLVAFSLIKMRVFVMRYVSVTPAFKDEFKNGFGEGLKAEDERDYKAMLFNLMPKITQALKSTDRAVALLRSQDLDKDPDGYMHYWNDCFTTFSRSVRKEVYRVKNPTNLGIVSPSARATLAGRAQARRGRYTTSVPTIACTERQHLDMLCIAMMHSTAFVSYEDMHDVRLWRVYAKDQALCNAIVQSLEGERVWSDGLGLRTYTALPR